MGKNILYSVFLMVLFSGCTSAQKVTNASDSKSFFRKTASEAMPVEPAELNGTIIGHGGESDIYYLQDKKLGKIYLEHTSAKTYEDIRNNEGGLVSLWGTWDESKDKTLVFFVRKVTVKAMPVERATLQGRIRGIGGESDIYYIVDKNLGRIFLNHRNADAYEKIRDNLGRSAQLTGTWDESQSTKLVFIVDTVVRTK